MDLNVALGFAGSTNNGVLATQKRDGRPQLSNITHLVGEDGTIRISITASRAKYANLRRDSRASLHVTEPYFGSWVVLECDATVSDVASDTSDAIVDDLVDLYRQVLGEHPDWDEYRAAMVRDGRVVVHLSPIHAYGQLN